MRAMTDLPGAVAPLGFFDPAGIFIYTSSTLVLHSINLLKHKHGRIAMLAAVALF
jgi:hypothetical protein